MITPPQMHRPGRVVYYLSTVSLVTHLLHVVEMASDPDSAHDEDEHSNIIKPSHEDLSIHHEPPRLNSPDERNVDPGKVGGELFRHEDVREGRYDAEGYNEVQVANCRSEDLRLERRKTSGELLGHAGAEEERGHEEDEEGRCEIGESWGRLPQGDRHTEEDGTHGRVKSADSGTRDSMNTSGRISEHQGQEHNQCEKQKPPRSGNRGEPGKHGHIAAGYHDTIGTEEVASPISEEACDDHNRVSGDFSSDNDEDFASDRRGGAKPLCSYDGASTASSSFRHPKGNVDGATNVSESDGAETKTGSKISGETRGGYHGAEDDDGDGEDVDDGEGRVQKREWEQRQECYQKLVGDGFRTISACFVAANGSIRGVENEQRNMLESETEVGEELLKFGIRVREATQLMQSQIHAAFTGEGLDSASASFGLHEQAPDVSNRQMEDRARAPGTIIVPQTSTTSRHALGDLPLRAEENIGREDAVFGRHGAGDIQVAYRSHRDQSEARGGGGSRAGHMGHFSKSVDINAAPQGLGDQSERQIFNDRRLLNDDIGGEQNGAGITGGSETALKRPRWDSSLGTAAFSTNGDSWRRA